jgi:hypothetical protein
VVAKASTTANAATTANSANAATAVAVASCCDYSSHWGSGFADDILA